MIYLKYTKKVDKPKTILSDEVLRIKANFRRLREEKGWTIYEAAKRARIASAGYVGNIEQANCNKGLGKRGLKKWAAVFGVDVSEFYKPISLTAVDSEIELLKQEVEKYSLAKIKKLRQLVPILLGGGLNHEQEKELQQENPEKDPGT